MIPGGGILNVGESNETGNGKSYFCASGSEGKLRLEYSENVKEAQNVEREINACSCTENGELKNFPVNHVLSVDGAKFECKKNGNRLEWDLQSGSDCKLNDASTLKLKEEKREGNVTYNCVGRSLEIMLVVKGIKYKK